MFSGSLPSPSICMAPNYNMSRAQRDITNKITHRTQKSHKTITNLQHCHSRHPFKIIECSDGLTLKDNIAFIGEILLGRSYLYLYIFEYIKYLNTYIYY